MIMPGENRGLLNVPKTTIHPPVPTRPQPDKPRIYELFDVEEDQVWRDIGRPGEVYRFHNGYRQKATAPDKWVPCFDEEHLIQLINAPQRVVIGPRLTEAELERCRVMGAKWVTRDNRGSYRVELWDFKPRKTEEDVYVPAVGDHSLAVVYEGLFPSVHPGDCIEAEVTGE